MTGIGSGYETYQPLMDALAAHVRQVWGPDYMLGDFLMEAHCVSMEEGRENESGEYVLVTSTHTTHIIEGLAGMIAEHGGGDTDE